MADAGPSKGPGDKSPGASLGLLGLVKSGQARLRGVSRGKSRLVVLGPQRVVRCVQSGRVVSRQAWLGGRSWLVMAGLVRSRFGRRGGSSSVVVSRGRHGISG